MPGIVAATRGNHGQSVAFAAARHRLPAVIVVPHGNSVEKNAAMAALGVELVEHGHDFQAAAEQPWRWRVERGLHRMPSLHPWTGRGRGELRARAVPRGPRSRHGLCPDRARLRHLRHHCRPRRARAEDPRSSACVAENAAAYALSFAAGRPVVDQRADTLADGMALPRPRPRGASRHPGGRRADRHGERAAIRAAMRAYFTDTHNLAEGAGAAPLAALLQERERMAGRRVGLVLSGGNVDRRLFAEVLGEEA
jgi:threonine dehydratase